MNKLLVSLLLAGLAAAADAPTAAAVTFRLRYDAAQPLSYHESFSGHGELTRHADGGQPARLEASGEGDRVWQVEDVDHDRYVVSALSTKGALRLSIPGANYVDDRPWRGFRLHLTDDGAVHAAEPVESAEADSQASGLPLDLDLSDLFVMAELGLLPPHDLAVGETWSFDQAAPAGPAKAHLEGRLEAVEGDPGERLARTRVAFKLPLPDRPTPAQGVVVSGELAGSLQVWFELDAGKVRSAKGPLSMTARYRRGGEGGRLLATAKLDLEVSVEPAEAKPRR